MKKLFFKKTVSTSFATLIGLFLLSSCSSNDTPISTDDNNTEYITCDNIYLDEISTTNISVNELIPEFRDFLQNTQTPSKGRTLENSSWDIDNIIECKDIENNTNLQMAYARNNPNLMACAASSTISSSVKIFILEDNGDGTFTIDDKDMSPLFSVRAYNKGNETVIECSDIYNETGFLNLLCNVAVGVAGTTLSIVTAPTVAGAMIISVATSVAAHVICD